MNAETVKRKTLGRGLNALFGEQDDAPENAAPNAAAAPAIKTSDTLPVDLLAPSPLQPRTYFNEAALDELAASIKEKGILQPILVRPDPHKDGHFEIIAGERRWRAAQRAQVHNVPVIIREFTDEQVLEVALIENLQRQDLSSVEEARGYKRLMDEFSHTQEEVSDIVGKSRTHIANTLRLLSLPENVQGLIDDGKLSPGQARPLIGLRNAEALAFTIIRKGLSARQAERLAKGHGTTKRATLRKDKDADTRAVEQTLEDATGYHVDISFNGKGGKVTIAYSSLEQLDDIVKRFSSGGKRARTENERDDGTVDLEELLERERLLESDEQQPRADHDKPYADPRFGDVGSGGSVAREPSKPTVPSDFGLSGTIEESLNTIERFDEDHTHDKPHETAHEDPTIDDVGASGSTHR